MKKKYKYFLDWRHGSLIYRYSSDGKPEFILFSNVVWTESNNKWNLEEFQDKSLFKPISEKAVQFFIKDGGFYFDKEACEGL